MALEDVVADYGLSVRSASESDAFAGAGHERLGRRLPRSLLRFASAPALAGVLATAYSAQVVFPDWVEPAPDDLAPGLQGEHVWLMTENQGVCVWVVPLEAGDDPPVLVAGDLPTRSAAEEYAASVDEFVHAWAWDRRCLEREPLIQAQAQPLDTDTLAYLRRTYRETTTTRGWPARQALRFESDDGLTLTVWDNHDQCDWWISSPSPDTTRQHVAVLRAYSDLASSFWSNDDPGIALLATLG